MGATEIAALITSLARLFYTLHRENREATVAELEAVGLRRDSALEVARRSLREAEEGGA